MRIAIISGSTRKGSESKRVSEYLNDRLVAMELEPTIIDLNEQRLPLYDDSRSGEWEGVWRGISEELEGADGVIFVSPEWDGMFSVGIHNLVHYLKYELADKPVMLVGVSSGRGGRYPLLQMRTMGYKNKRFVIIPESIFIDGVGEALKENAFTDPRLTERCDYALETLKAYAIALFGVRESGLTDYKKFPNGL